MNPLKLCVIPGDGVGREVIPCAVQVLQHVINEVDLVTADAGWDCFTCTGYALPDATISAIEACGAVLFGAVSSPSRKVDGYRSPIVQMRQRFDLYANLRPTRELKDIDGARRLTGEPVDLIIVRENTQGLYIGREYMRGDEAIAERVITAAASQRIARVAFKLASARPRRQVTIVHKANILPVTDGTFRDAVRA
ncbi:MAG TPA: isocitrate/isopropylmalate family dehydrogenase, partial [Anaerolineae bacterium]